VTANRKQSVRQRQLSEEKDLTALKLKEAAGFIEEKQASEQKIKDELFRSAEESKAFLAE